MKTPAFLTPLLLSNSKSSRLNKGLAQNNNQIQAVPPSYASSVKSSGLGYKKGSDLGDENKNKFADIFKNSAFKKTSKSKEKVSASTLQSMLEKSEDESIIRAYKSGGANPALEFDIKDKSGNVLSSGNNMAHLIANEFMQEDKWKGRHAFLLGITEEFATSGGDLNKKNSGGITPIELTKKIKDGFGRVVTQHMKKLKDHQMVSFREAGGLAYAPDEKYHSIYTTPTDQMFNLVSQNYDKLTEIAKERIPYLVVSGVRLETKSEDNGRTILELAKENWGKDKSFQLSVMVGIVKDIDDIAEKQESESVGKSKSTKNYKDYSKEELQDSIEKLEGIKETKELSDRFNESLKIFSSDRDVEKKQSKQR